MTDQERQQLKELELKWQTENGDLNQRTTVALESIAMSLVHMEKDNRTMEALQEENRDLQGQLDNAQSTIDEHLGGVLKETADKVKAMGGATDAKLQLRIDLEETQINLRKSKAAQAKAQVEADVWKVVAELMKRVYLQPTVDDPIETTEKGWRAKQGNVMTWSAALEQYHAFVHDISPEMKQGNMQAELEEAQAEVNRLRQKVVELEADNGVEVHDLKVQVSELEANVRSTETMRKIAQSACRHWKMMSEIYEHAYSIGGLTIKEEEEFVEIRERLRQLWLQHDEVSPNDWDKASEGFDYRRGQTHMHKMGSLANREQRQRELNAANEAAESAAERDEDNDEG